MIINSKRWFRYACCSLTDVVSVSRMVESVSSLPLSSAMDYTTGCYELQIFLAGFCNSDPGHFEGEVAHSLETRSLQHSIKQSWIKLHISSLTSWLKLHFSGKVPRWNCHNDHGVIHDHDHVMGDLCPRLAECRCRASYLSDVRCLRSISWYAHQGLG